MHSRNILSFTFLACAMFTVVFSQEASKEERTAMKKLKSMVRNIVYEDYMMTDDFLGPFLRAKKLDPERAKTMVENMVKWRRDNDVDTIQDTEFTAVEKCMKVWHGGIDKAGRPVVYSNMGVWDIRKCALAGQTPQMIKYIVKHYLEGPTRVARTLRNPQTGGNVTQFTSIMNMQGFNLRQGACLGCLQFFGTWAYNVETYYPASAFKYFFPNMPQAFQVVLDFVKPILTPPTSSALTPMGFNKDENMKILTNVIDISQLPAMYGGQRKETAADRALY